MKKHIPNTLTLMNLISGSIGVILVLNGELLLSILMVLLSAVFDFFDGFTARLLKVTSKIGADLDSLADVVSFGLVPALSVYMMIKSNEFIAGLSHTLQLILPFSALLIVAFSALRLAKFNNDTRQKTDFIGLPTPANALFILPLSLYSNIGIYDNLISMVANSFVFQMLLVVLSSLLLVSEIKLLSLKFSDKDKIKNIFRIALIFTSILLIAFFEFAGLSFSILAYILFSILYSFNPSIKQRLKQ